MQRDLLHLILLSSFAASLYAADPAEKLTARYLCLGCHAVDEVRAGPAFQDVALRYQSQKQASHTLMHSIQNGSVGQWGSTPMPGMPIPDADLKIIVQWILQQTP